MNWSPKAASGGCGIIVLDKDTVSSVTQVQRDELRRLSVIVDDEDPGLRGCDVWDGEFG